MDDCIFCKIAEGKIGARIAHRDNDVVGFYDLTPQAPVHIVIIPRQHIERISDMSEKETSLLGKLCLVATKLAREKNIESSGYRLVINCNKDAGQAVFHVHLHLLGGRKFSWPPG
ncbi:MAG: histidine triad nucleotide-binding protein [Omnitrophica bacterium RBG_13_46_9]|nr:MAG: histidine triad nucleotide-binding protein [Omnitrophica bacterium RBG_13_46_9]